MKSVQPCSDCFNRVVGENKAPTADLLSVGVTCAVPRFQNEVAAGFFFRSAIFVARSKYERRLRMQTVCSPRGMDCSNALHSTSRLMALAAIVSAAQPLLIRNTLLALTIREVNETIIRYATTIAAQCLIQVASTENRYSLPSCTGRPRPSVRRKLSAR